MLLASQLQELAASARKWAIAAVASSLVIVLGCGPGSSRPQSPEASTTRDGLALRPVPLPDVSQTSRSAQQQIQTQHAKLMALVSAETTSLPDLSLAYGEMGKLLMAAQYPEAAEAALVNAQTVDPSEFRWPYYLAHLYRTQGQLEKSRALFERALQLRPDDMAALVWTGDVYLASGFNEAAERQFAKALSIDPESVSARYGLGRAALAQNDPRRAVTYFEEVLKRNPNAGDAHYPLSQAYAALGDSARANEQLRLRRTQKILPADPLMAELDRLVESPQTYETLGIRALDEEDWQTDAENFRRGLALDPTSPALRFRLATAINMMGDQAGAEQLFTDVIRDKPDYFPAQFSLGVMLQSKGRHGEAAERFRTALVDRPDYSQARLRLASSLIRLGRTKDAVSEYEQVTRLNPDIAEGQIGYAMALTRLNQSALARDVFARQMSAHPEQMAFIHGLARLLAAAPDAQVRDGPRALQLVQDLAAKGRNPELGETMAMALAESGQYERAVGVQRDVIAAAERAGLQAMKSRLARNLELYQRGEPCRTPWTLDEMP